MTNPETGTDVPDLIDIAALLRPIPGAEPAGEDLRHGPEIDALNEARRMDDDTDKGIWQADAKKADWKLVLRAGTELLTARSKDLQVAVWVTQALRHVHGVAGLAAGLHLVRGLSETFWNDLHPRFDGEDLEPRIGPFLWLDEHLSRDLLTTPVMVADAGEDVHSLQTLQAAQRLQKLAARDAGAYRGAVDDGAVTVEQIAQGRERTPTGFYTALRRDARAARDALDGLHCTLDALAGRDAPSLRRLETTLEELMQFSVDELRQRGVPLEDTVAPAHGEEAGEMAEAAKPSAPFAPAGKPRSRDEAYALLQQIADFLAVEEPHSPTSYLVRRAASWGRLSLPELYADLLGDREEIGRLFAVLRLGERD